MNHPLYWDCGILEGKSLEEIGTFLKALPERLQITDPLPWYSRILADKPLEEIFAFNDTLPDNLKMTEL
jgi:hypothetical protein